MRAQPALPFFTQRKRPGRWSKHRNAVSSSGAAPQKGPPGCKQSLAKRQRTAHPVRLLASRHDLIDREAELQRLPDLAASTPMPRNGESRVSALVVRVTVENVGGEILDDASIVTPERDGNREQ